MDSQGVYDEFLKLLKKARERKWRSVKVHLFIAMHHAAVIVYNGIVSIAVHSCV